MLRAGRSTDLGVAISTIAVLAILVIFFFPLLSRPDEPAGASKPVAVLHQQAAKAPVRPAVAERRAEAPTMDFRRRNLVEMSFGLTLIVGVALIAMALGSRGRPS